MEASRADDFVYEEELARNPYSIRNWWGYIQSKQQAPAKVRGYATPAAAALLSVWTSCALPVVLAPCLLAVSFPPQLTMPPLAWAQDRVLVYERALQAMPGCFKIWRDYLKFRHSKVVLLHVWPATGRGFLCLCCGWPASPGGAPAPCSLSARNLCRSVSCRRGVRRLAPTGGQCVRPRCWRCRGLTLHPPIPTSCFAFAGQGPLHFARLVGGTEQSF